MQWLGHGAYSEVIDVEAADKGVWIWCWVLVHIHTGGHTIVLCDGTCIEVLHYLSSVQVSAANLHMTHCQCLTALGEVA